MANKDLFKQAIAEAKSVREAAIANAKEALEETLTPHLKDMLAAKLQEMEDSQTEEVVNESEEVEETAEETVNEEKVEESTDEEVNEEETVEEATEEVMKLLLVQNVVKHTKEAVVLTKKFLKKKYQKKTLQK